MEDDVILTDNSDSGGIIGLQEGYPIEIPNAAAGSKVIYLQTDIVAKQGGSGDSSPTNIRPISGWTGADITRTGINLFGGVRLFDRIKIAIPSATTVNANTHVIQFSRTAETTGAIAPNGVVPFKPNTRYTFIMKGYSSSSNGYSNLHVYYTDGTSKAIPSFGGASNVTATVCLVSAEDKTVDRLVKYSMGGSTTLYCDECAVLEGVHTAEEFVSYTGETVSMDWSDVATTHNGTVYGGTLDALGGKLYEEARIRSFTGTEGWSQDGSGAARYYRLRQTTDLTLYETQNDKTLCSHFTAHTVHLSGNTDIGYWVYNSSANGGYYFCIRPGVDSVTDLDTFKAWLAAQNSAGTPVQVLFWRQQPLEYNIDPI